MTTTAAGPGALMLSEMGEQPDVLRRLIERRSTDMVALRAVVAIRPPGVVIVARGSSLNAGTFLAYAIEIASGLPVSLARPSVFTRYGARPDYTGWLAIALSQSGRTPEIVETARAIQASGATLVSMTNDDESPLAALGEAHLFVDAGVERAVPATKTVSAQMVLALTIADALSRDRDEADVELDRLPDAVVALLARTDADGLAERWRGRDRLTVLGRGYGFAAANEIALKVRETASVYGEAWSVTAFRHGPIAGLGPDVAALGLSLSREVDADSRVVFDQLRARGVDVARCAPADEPTTTVDLAIPTEFGERGTAILTVIAGQQLAHAWSVRQGRDPDRPSGLQKVTLTQ